MAPELLRGGRSSVASDLWALGVVIHEIVFGEKPRWGGGPAPEMLAPDLGRKLTDEERPRPRSVPRLHRPRSRAAAAVSRSRRRAG